MKDYIAIGASVRNELKKPFGKICKNLELVKELSKKNRVISVGDVSTLALLAIGIHPYLAVFDFKYMRKKLAGYYQNIILRYFRSIKKYKNPKGTLSLKLAQNAKKLLRHHCGVLIDGEEDITALAFMRILPKNYVLVYGQPHKGIVLVKNDEKTRKRVELIFKKLKVLL